MFAYNGRNQVASLLDKYSKYMKEQETDNSTAIIQKAIETHSSIVEILIKHGADETIKDNKGNVAIDFDYTKKKQLTEAEAAAAAVLEAAAKDAPVGKDKASSAKSAKSDL